MGAADRGDEERPRHSAEPEGSVQDVEDGRSSRPLAVGDELVAADVERAEADPDHEHRAEKRAPRGSQGHTHAAEAQETQRPEHERTAGDRLQRAHRNEHADQGPQEMGAQCASRDGQADPKPVAEVPQQGPVGRGQNAQQKEDGADRDKCGSGQVDALGGRDQVAVRLRNQ